MMHTRGNTEPGTHHLSRMGTDLITMVQALPYARAY